MFGMQSADVRHVLLLKLFTSVFAQLRGIGRALQEDKEIFRGMGFRLTSSEACKGKQTEKKQGGAPDFIHRTPPRLVAVTREEILSAAHDRLHSTATA